MSTEKSQIFEKFAKKVYFFLKFCYIIEKYYEKKHSCVG